MATSYGADLGQGQVVYLQNQGAQTQITLDSATAGQQQRQSTGFTTGEWTGAPTLFRTGMGAIVRIETAQGSFFVQLQAGGMQSLTQPPALNQAEVIPLQQTTDPATPSLPEMRPMQSMQPMQPMKMGNMEMRMNPMQMRMGNMEMQMGGSSAAQASAQQAPAQASAKRFCTQCGSAVAAEDKFCAHCGFQLRAD